MDECSKIKTVSLNVHCALYDGGYIYLFPEEFNCLYRFDVSDGGIEDLGSIPWENKCENRLIDKIIKAGDRIFFVPFSAKYLTVYDTATSEYSKVDIRNVEGNHVQGVFVDAFASDQYIYLIGGTAPAIVRVDLNDYSVQVLKSCFDDVNAMVFNPTDSYFRSCGIVYDDCFITPFCNANAVLIFYYREMKYKIIQISNDENGYSGIREIGNCFWLSPRRGGMSLVKCDSNFKVIKTKQIYENTLLSGIEIINGNPTLFTFQPITHQYEHISFMAEKERISTDDVYCIYKDLRTTKLTIEDRNGKIFDDIIKIPARISDIGMWIKQYSVNGIIPENRIDSLEMFIAAVMSNNEEA